MERTNTPPVDQTHPEVWEGLIRGATRIALGMERITWPHRMRSMYRRNVVVQARRALDPSIDSELLAAETPPIGESPVPLSCFLSVANHYRQVLDGAVTNWTSPVVAEGVMAIIDETLDDELAEREWVPKIVPEPPDGKYRYELIDRTSRFEVTEGGRRLTHVYLRAYYPTARHVVAHIVGQLEGEELFGDELVDFTVWSDDQIAAAGHLRWDRDVEGLLNRPMIEQFQIAYFDADGSDYDLGDRADASPPFEYTLPGWPTREQWEADGSDKIILRPKGDPAWDRPPVV